MVYIPPFLTRAPPPPPSGVERIIVLFSLPLCSGKIDTLPFLHQVLPSPPLRRGRKCRFFFLQRQESSCFSSLLPQMEAFFFPPKRNGSFPKPSPRYEKKNPPSFSRALSVPLCHPLSLLFLSFLQSKVWKTLPPFP